jgi:4-amino-4-deoxy-L-arabinose transferase-like glycosyltransferase
MKILETDRPGRDRLILAVFAVVLLGVFWLSLPARFQANQNYDYTCCYETSARNWIGGNGFIYSNGHFAAAYPPGYPVLLAGVFIVGKVIGDGVAMALFIALCEVASVLAMYTIGRFLFGAWAGRIAALLLITYPFFLWMLKQPNSEGPFLPFVLWGFYGYVRLVAPGPTNNKPWKWAVLSGVCWALAALVRPIGVLGGFVTAASLILFGRRQPIMQRTLLAALLVAVNFATILPWEVIAKDHLGRWILVGDNSGTGYIDGVTFGLHGVALHPAPVPSDVEELMARAESRKDQIRSTGGFVNFLKEEAQTHPTAFIKLMYLKTTRVWYGTLEGYFEGINKLIELVYIITACAGLWWMGRRLRMSAVAWGIAAVVCYFWFMAVLVNPILRYMVPATALMMLAVAVTVIVIVKKLTGLDLTASGLLKSD